MGFEVGIWGGTLRGNPPRRNCAAGDSTCPDITTVDPGKKGGHFPGPGGCGAVHFAVYGPQLGFNSAASRLQLEPSWSPVGAQLEPS